MSSGPSVGRRSAAESRVARVAEKPAAGEPRRSSIGVREALTMAGRVAREALRERLARPRVAPVQHVDDLRARGRRWAHARRPAGSVLRPVCLRHLRRPSARRPARQNVLAAFAHRGAHHEVARLDRERLLDLQRVARVREREVERLQHGRDHELHLLPRERAALRGVRSAGRFSNGHLDVEVGRTMHPRIPKPKGCHACAGSASNCPSSMRSGRNSSACGEQRSRGQHVSLMEYKMHARPRPRRRGRAARWWRTC